MTTTPAAPLAPAQRSLAPDLARGVMLLAIALANSHYFLTAPEIRGGYPQSESILDRSVAWTLSTFVDGRAFPMFGFLFGYGVALLARRHGELGRRGVRRLLRRRAAALIAVGVIDGLLFFVGDILAMYGVLLFAGMWAIWWGDRVLIGLAALVFAIGCVPGGVGSPVSPDGPGPEMLPHDITALLAERPPAIVFVALLGPVGFLGPFLLGLVAGRHRILERADEYRVLLAFTSTIGILVAVLGAQPAALFVSGVTGEPSQGVLAAMSTLHDQSGVLGGVGYAASIAVVASRVRRGRVVEALSAVGQRSMSCYLMQSVAWAILFTPFALDLSGTLTVASTAGVATAVWLVSVIVADVLRRHDRRGPFEVFLRQVTYGRR
ncbi:DUF418 domain-containing protein [Williamsia sp. M5A3_1d]